MMTPPRNWHTDGHLYPYSDQDKKDDDVGFFSVFFLTIRCIFSFPFYIIKEIIILIFGDSVTDPTNPQDAESSFSLFVFGYTGAGKSTFLEKLGANVNTAGYGTAEEKYPSFTTKVGDKTISIKEGIDIGGDKRYLANGTIEKMLNEKDKVIFIFAATSFLDKKNIHYRGEIMSRLQALYDVSAHRSKVSIIVSRLDKCDGERLMVANEIKKEFIDKYYRDILNDSFGVFNLTDEKDIEMIKQMIFK